ncbi:hypothetical protein AB0C10_36670 [Microbispora amethystogenes]|uniref:hypothetical protein n=1 Tax=Microbispora amethystogenes TaxID=1427754 RepID=UPI0033DB0BA4
MSMTTPPPEPSPDDVERGIAAIEDHLAAQTPPPPSPPAVIPDELGETKRVQRLRAEVAEAHQLAELQDDDTPFQLDTDKVRKHRRRTWEAARLHQLAQDPAALAYRDAKVRKVTTGMTLTAAGIALAVSSIGVQASVAKALDLQESDGLGFWAAYGVEAVLSLPLLAAVGVQAYSAIRGKVVDRKSPEGRRLFRTELVLLGLTLTLNCWPAFKTDFDLLDLIVHSLGPVAAVLSVWVLPTIWKILSDLPSPWFGTPAGTPPVQGPYRENGSDRYTLSTAPVQVLADHVRDMIARGSLPANPGLHKIRTALGVGVEKAREVQKLLTGGA